MADAQDGTLTQALLFDLGGVIFGTDFGRAFAHWAELSGAHPEILAERFSVDDAYCKHEKGELTASGYFETLRESLGVDLSDADFEDGWNRIYVGLFPGIERLLKRAADVLPVYAFTNSNLTHHRFWSVEYASVLSIFSDVFDSCELGERKPQASAFTKVANRIGVEPNRILFFDDLLVNVQGAASIGMATVFVQSPADTTDAINAIIAGRV